MEKEDKEFRVIDRRGSASPEAEKPKAESKVESKVGEGFVMKESKAAPEVPAQEIDFSTFVFSLATGALINLGLVPDPASQKTQKNLELAKQNIDILGMMKEKTKGNLTHDEEALLESLLTEIRLRFVEASR